MNIVVKLLAVLTPARVIAGITTIVGLFVSQGNIQNGTSKLVVGLAVTFVPLVLAFLHDLVSAIDNHGHVIASRPAPLVTVTKDVKPVS